MRLQGRRYVQTVTRVFTSEQGVLGLLTANDLVWRTLADLPAAALQRYMALVSESIVAPAVFSLVTGLDVEPRGIALIAQWAFIASLFYVLAPRVFRRAATELSHDTRFRLTTALAALGFALAMTTLILERPWPLERELEYAAFVGAACLSLCSYGVYFRIVQAWSTRSITERIDLLDAFVPIPDRDRAELRASGRASDRWSRVRVRTIFLALPFVCTIAAFFLGLLAVVLLGLYPLGELLVLTGVGVNVLTARYGVPLGLEPPGAYALDIEARVYDTLAAIELDIKGWTTLLLVLLCGLGFQMTAFVSTLAVVRTGTLPLLATVVETGLGPLAVAVPVWNTVGMALSLSAAILFGLWYWLRVFERVPAFLATWAVSVGRRAPADVETATARGRSVTRPPGLMAPPALVFLVTVLWIAFSPPAAGGLRLTTPDLAYAIAWPLSVALLGGAVWRTRTTAPQPPASDAVAIPGALVIQFAGELSFLWLANIGSSQPVTLQVPPFGVFLVLLVPWLFFLEDVRQWTRQHEYVSEYLYIGYFLLFGCLMLLLGVYATGTQGRLYLAFGGVVVAPASVFAVDEYREPTLE